MNGFGMAAVVLTSAVLVAPAAWAREWCDISGKYRVEAELVSVKNGKVYLEKSSGEVIAVPLERLSRDDLLLLKGLPECADYFAANPLPGEAPSPATPPDKSAAEKTEEKAPEPESGKAPSRMAVIHVDDESKVGEVRRFPDLGWGVESLAFSPDGALLAAGKMDEAVMVFDVDKANQVAFVDKLRHLDQVTCVAFTPDGKKLLAGGSKGCIQIWNVGAGGVLSEANRFVGHNDGILTITVSADGKHVLSGGDEKKVRYWDLETCREQFAIAGFSRSVLASYLTRGGKQGLACDGKKLVLIDIAKGEVVQSMSLISTSRQAAAISPDGSRVVVDERYSLRVWEIATGKQFPPFEGKEINWFAVFLPDNRHLLAGVGGAVNLLDTNTGQRIASFDTPEPFYVQRIACSPDGRHFAAIPASAGQTLQVFRMPADLAGAKPIPSDGD